MQRVGLLVPSVNTVVEPEFWRLAPPTVSLHSARMRNSTCGVDDARQMLAHAERAADEVGSALVEIVAFACTASSFVDGRNGEAELRDSITAAANAPAITTSGAVAEALELLGSRQIALYTPYPAELNSHEVDFLASHGVETLCAYGLGISVAVEIADVSASKLLDFIDAQPPPTTADTIFLSCTNLATFEVIRPLEAAYGLPVVSSNSATFAAIAQRFGWDTPAALGALAATASAHALT